MAEMKSCNICGRFFELEGAVSDTCPICRKYYEDNYNKLREYLFLHPKATIFEVSTTLDIPLKVIKRYLREERLEIVEHVNTFLLCEQCKKPLRSGMLCKSCKSGEKDTNQDLKQNNNLGNEKGSVPSQNSGKNLRFL